jgi:hypothetical protein
MKTRLFNLAAGVSLVLCLAAIGFVVRSLFARDTVGLLLINQPAVRYAVSLDSWQGSAVVMFTRTARIDGAPVPEWTSQRPQRFRVASFPRGDLYEQLVIYQNMGHWFAGFAAGSGFTATKPKTGPITIVSKNWLVAAPWWAIAVVAAVLPTLWLKRRRDQRRLSLAGRCRNCGYDLRATPDRCPECGMNVEPQMNTAR